MPQATFNFPKGFLWGTATSSHQVEGNNTNNNWWAWEQEPGRIANGDKSGLACDWWGGRWKEDFDRAHETGQNAHRLSVEWSRIQPTPDRWDESALDYYRQMVRGLADRGMMPLVTLHHFSDPLWLVELGGWESEAVVELFSKFARKVVEALHEYTNLWVTINEPNVYACSGYLLGVFPPGKKQDLASFSRVMANMVCAHAAAYAAIHAEQNTARVGIALNYRSLQGARAWFMPDRWIARLQSGQFNDSFPRALMDGRLNLLNKRLRFPQAARTQDFFGLNYYTRDLVSFSPLAVKEAFGRRRFPTGADLSDTGFIANDPDGMWEALNWSRQFKVPILITENGVENASDQLRPRYLIQHLHQVWRAVNFNWPIKGYFHWTLVDNFEWERGWTQRFGLWDLQIPTQVRRKRPSVDLYAAICSRNAFDSEIVQRFAPEIQEKIFPG